MAVEWSAATTRVLHVLLLSKQPYNNNNDCDAASLALHCVIVPGKKKGETGVKNRADGSRGNECAWENTRGTLLSPIVGYGQVGLKGVDTGQSQQ